MFVFARVAASIAAVAAVTVLYFRFLSANPTTVALCYLVLILLIATQWGIVESTVASPGYSVFQCLFSPACWPIDDC
jgi:hypothetical protein